VSSLSIGNEVAYAALSSLLTRLQVIIDAGKRNVVVVHDY
jgi:hypothetical protein